MEKTQYWNRLEAHIKRRTILIALDPSYVYLKVPDDECSVSNAAIAQAASSRLTGAQS
ncbi:hypothetical protein [Vacuolonema iberomarrocanum]|uniref:hypothetical protein n=1 Tax=Vacuolonema iberomarrocanum TaxID=3454632 RepID=UPI0019E0AD74|nr:hypothetical protein [filamentous cyanobacterium LEGE 07170]